MEKQIKRVKMYYNFEILGLFLIGLGQTLFQIATHQLGWNLLLFDLMVLALIVLLSVKKRRIDKVGTDGFFTNKFVRFLNEKYILDAWLILGKGALLGYIIYGTVQTYEANVTIGYAIAMLVGGLTLFVNQLNGLMITARNNKSSSQS